MTRDSAMVSIVFACVLAGRSTNAEENGHIRDPNLLPELQNKIVVQEYKNPQQTTWGLQISKILTLETLGFANGVPSFGVVNLSQDERPLEIDSSAVTSIAERQEASIVIWGEFYESGEKLYLHSHLRIIPRPQHRLKLAVSAAT